MTSFDASLGQITIPSSINAAGTIAGYYYGAQSPRGFLRDANGNISFFLTSLDLQV